MITRKSRIITHNHAQVSEAKSSIQRMSGVNQNIDRLKAAFTILEEGQRKISDDLAASVARQVITRD